MVKGHNPTRLPSDTHHRVGQQPIVVSHPGSGSLWVPLITLVFQCAVILYVLLWCFPSIRKRIKRMRRWWVYCSQVDPPQLPPAQTPAHVLNNAHPLLQRMEQPHVVQRTLPNDVYENPYETPPCAPSKTRTENVVNE